MVDRRVLGSWRGIAGTLAVGVALVLVGVLITNLWHSLDPFGRFGSKTVDRSQPALLESIRDLSEYHAAVGNFQVVIDVERDVKFVPSVLAGQRTLFVAAGSVNAFVDFSGMTGDALKVSPDAKTVEVRLPKPSLDKPNLDQSRSYVFAQQRGAFNRLGDFLSGADQQQFYLLAEQKIAAAAAESTLADQAESNTRTMLTGMLAALGYRATFPPQN